MEDTKPNKFTRVSDDILSLWKNKKLQGDIEAIAEKGEVDSRTISRALHTGRARQNIIELINSYYGIQTGNAA